MVRPPAAREHAPHVRAIRVNIAFEIMKRGANMSAKTNVLPITIITGFLGAGKTTLLYNILRGDHGLRVAVLVNDFGAVNIDSELIVGVEGETVSLSNGCICCTIRDDLLSAVFNLIQRDNPPEYVVIETSGVSDPHQVAQTFLMPALRPYVKVDSIVAVVDAEQVRDLKDDQAMLAMDQISAADMLVLNKVDLVSKAELEQVRAWIYDVTPRARILETTHGRAPMELLLGVGEFTIERLASRETRDIHVHGAQPAPDHDDGHHEHDHDRDHSLVFNTWHYQSDEPMVYEALCDAVDGLPATIFRAKGIVYLKEAPDRKTIMHVVGRRAMLTMAEKWGGQQLRTQIVVIGSYGGVDAGMLQQLFDACRASAIEANGNDKLQHALNWVRRNWPTAFTGN
jgi:G3E family GTPase